MIPQNDNAIIPIAAAQYPNDLWRGIIAYLRSQDPKADFNSLATVSKQLLMLWRESALTLHIPLNDVGPQDLEDTDDPSEIDTGALDSIEGGALSTFRNAEFVTIQVESSALHWRKGYNHHLAARGFLPRGNGMSIDLRLANTLSFYGALVVMKTCPAVASRVTMLSIEQLANWPEQITIKEVWALIKCLPNLKALTLRGFDRKRVDSACLLKLATLEGLCHLGVDLDFGFTPQGLEGLASSSLQSLSLTNVHSPAGLVEHIATMPKLKWLKLTLFSNKDEFAKLLAQASFDQVEYLDICSDDVTTTLCGAVARSFPNLKGLTLNCFQYVEVPGKLVDLSTLTSLEHLEIINVNSLSQEPLNALVSQMPKLKKLHLVPRYRPSSEIQPASNLQGESVSITVFGSSRFDFDEHFKRAHQLG